MRQKLKKFLFPFYLLLSLTNKTPSLYAQNKNIDSLKTLLIIDKADTNKVIHLNYLNREYINIGLYDSVIRNGDEAFHLAKQLNYKAGLVNFYNNAGLVCWNQSDYSKALENYFNALKIDEELKDKNGIAKRYGNIGLVYWNLGNYPKALDYYFKALKIAEELGNKSGIARHLCNIGLIYHSEKDHIKALDCYFKALKIAEELGDKNGIATCLSNIGIVYENQDKHLKALAYYLKALKIAEELCSKNLTRDFLGNIGSVYNSLKDYPKAIDYYFKALKIAEQLDYKKGVAVNLGSIGVLYTKTKKFKEAERYLSKSINIDNAIGAMDDLMLSEESISKLYDTLGEYKLALNHYRKAVTLKDTLFSLENKKQLTTKELNFEFDKKEAATKALHDKEIAVEESENKKQRFILILVSGLLLLVFLFAGFVARSLSITRKQKDIIQSQKNEVSLQKEIVEKQKEKIIDSITYAQRIQQSILIEENEIRNYLPNSFIYYLPKDIVSGDFYWCSAIENKIILAAIDCTGHGVPGAFMSMIGNSLLNQIVNEKNITQPSEILRLLNIGVYEALHQEKTGTLSRDGMDVALCCIDYKNNELQFAGAQNSLFIVSNNQITIIKADKQTVGGGTLTHKGNPLEIKYTNHYIPIEKNMSFYLFSDGYMDQFGGEERKKFGTQKFKDLLLNNQHLSMQKQKEIIASAHENWKGNTLQIDDILVIGVKL